MANWIAISFICCFNNFPFPSSIHANIRRLRLVLNCGQFSLTLAEDAGTVWIGAMAQTNVEIQTEVFGFGSGDFLRQSEASDAMSDGSGDGRWLPFAINDSSTNVILEKGRKGPEHLENQPFFNKVELSLENCVWM